MNTEDFSIEVNQNESDSINSQIRTAVNQPACFQTVVVIADDLQKNTCSEQANHAEYQNCRIQPVVNNSQMICRKRKRTEQNSGFLMCFLKEMTQQTSEKCFFQKGIYHSDIGEHKQTILFCKLFFRHEILPDRLQIQMIFQQKKTDNNHQKYSSHEEI